MKRYLAAFHRIRQDISDLSDYENFVTAAIQYLGKHPDAHSRFVRPLCKALVKFKSPYMISLAYRILAHLRCTPERTNAGRALLSPIPKKVIKEHYKNKTIRGSILAYVSNKGLRFLDDRILKTLVLDPCYVSGEVFSIISRNPECVKDFMFVTAPSYLIKQLCIIENCFVGYNLEYYFQMLGSLSKIRASRAYTAFTAFFMDRARRTEDGCTTVAGRHVLFNRKLLYRPQNSLHIESPSNFLTFGFNFVQDRDELVRLCSEKNMAEIGRILATYSDCACPLDVSGTQLAYSRLPQPEEAFFTVGTDFDYLFDGRNFKDNVCDCPEI